MCANSWISEITEWIRIVSTTGPIMHGGIENGRILKRLCFIFLLLIKNGWNRSSYSMNSWISVIFVLRHDSRQRLRNDFVGGLPSILRLWNEYCKSLYRPYLSYSFFEFIVFSVCSQLWLCIHMGGIERKDFLSIARVTSFAISFIDVWSRSILIVPCRLHFLQFLPLEAWQ